MSEWDSVWVGSNLSLAIRGDRIVWVGDSIPKEKKELVKDQNYHEYNDRVITPGLIDPHTHLVYAGNRAHEFEMRLKGKSYADIAKAGGGIRSTVQATRKASFEELYTASRLRLETMMRLGVTTVEIKSGYGLDLHTEIKMLKVAKTLGEELPVDVIPTYLGAHTLPKEYEGDPDKYIDFVCSDVLPEIKEARLASSVDVFCESIGFSLSHTQKVFESALALGFDIKCHAEQLTSLGATALASKKGALSCDHLEYLDLEGIDAMSESGTVAVLLPGAYYFLKETKKPPIEALRQHHIKMAIATDCNPGSSPTTSLPLMMNMASVLFGLTVQEVWEGVTKHAALALGLKDRGEIKVGQKADFCLWPFKDKANLSYAFGEIITPIRVFNGTSYTSDTSKS